MRIALSHLPHKRPIGPTAIDAVNADALEVGAATREMATFTFVVSGLTVWLIEGYVGIRDAGQPDADDENADHHHDAR
ncbi:MAG TPA: hypothetical protein VIA18_01005 [Polyangia bacterium]|jgi:hypothetical protein|nr:hypothetical protein [Polyangia bacterium]